MHAGRSEEALATPIQDGRDESTIPYGNQSSVNSTNIKRDETTIPYQNDDSIDLIPFDQIKKEKKDDDSIDSIPFDPIGKEKNR